MKSRDYLFERKKERIFLVFFSILIFNYYKSHILLISRGNVRQNRKQSQRQQTCSLRPH